MKYLLSIIFVSICTLGFAQGNNGLVAHWNFNGNAHDVSGHNLNGTVVGATLAPGYNGIINTAYYFNGVNNGIYVPYNSMMNLDSFSVCALVKPKGFYSGDCMGNYILGRDVEGQGGLYSLFYTCYAYDSTCSIYDPAHEYFCTGNHMPVNYPSAIWVNGAPVDTAHWYCATMTYAHDTERLYVDGILHATIYGPDTYAPSTAGISIGSRNDTTSFPYWLNGSIDDIRVYGRALSFTEVTQYCDTAKQLPQLAVTNRSTEPEIVIAPNPAHNSINVLLPGSDNNGEIKLLNTMGQLISSQKINGNTTVVNISNIPTGMYLLKIECNNVISVNKIFKN